MSRHTADTCCCYLTGCNSLVWCSMWACLRPLSAGVFGPPSDGGWGQINHRVLNKQFSGNFYNEYIAVELPRTRFGPIWPSQTWTYDTLFQHYFCCFRCFKLFFASSLIERLVISHSFQSQLCAMAILSWLSCQEFPNRIVLITACLSWLTCHD